MGNIENCAGRRTYDFCNDVRSLQKLPRLSCSAPWGTHQGNRCPAHDPPERRATRIGRAFGMRLSLGHAGIDGGVTQASRGAIVETKRKPLAKQ